MILTKIISGGQTGADRAGLDVALAHGFPHGGWWLNSPPLKLADLKGKVVLIRWWTAPGCPYCSATAPALNEFQEQHPGLVVIGFYHHKSDQPLTPEHVAK